MGEHRKSTKFANYCYECAERWPCNAVQIIDVLRAERDAAVENERLLLTTVATGSELLELIRADRNTLLAERDAAVARAEKAEVARDHWKRWASEAAADLAEIRLRGQAMDERLTIFERIAAWQRETFPHASPYSVIAHLAKEIDELAVDPIDAGEIADCYLLLTGLALLAGIDPFEAMERKLAINKSECGGSLTRSAWPST